MAQRTLSRAAALHLGLATSHLYVPAIQPEEPWSRPMRPGDGTRDLGQRPVPPLLEQIPPLQHQHMMGSAMPVAAEPCAGHQHRAGAADAAGLFQLPGGTFDLAAD